MATHVVVNPVRKAVDGKHYEARVTSQVLPGGRVAMLRPNPSGAGFGACINCSKELRFDRPHPSESIQEVACSVRCAREAGFYPRVIVERMERIEAAPKTETVVTSVPTKAPMKTGTASVALTPEPIPAKVVQDEPPVKAKRGNCPVCGGVPYKRGWKHTEGCSNSTKAKLAKAKEDAGMRRVEKKAAKGMKMPAGLDGD